MAVATLKHVLAYSLENWSPEGNYSTAPAMYNRGQFDAMVSAYDLEDTYGQPFKRAIDAGGAAGIMWACDKVNGVPPPASTDLRDRLRSWSFDGYRTTDGNGICGMAEPNKRNFTDNRDVAVQLGLRDGETDIDDGSCYSEHLTEAYRRGLVNDSMIRRALTNTFRIRFRLGLFDRPQSGGGGGSNAANPPWSRLGIGDIDSPAARQLNLEASRQSLILLQNRNRTLPFAVGRSGSVVVVGASANSTRLLGGGHYARSLAMVGGFETGGFPGIPQAIEALLRSAGSAMSVEWHPGMACSPHATSVCTAPAPDAALEAAAVDAASAATQVVLVLNLQSVGTCTSEKAFRDAGDEFNPCGMESESFDRHDIRLPRLQRQLAAAVLSATKRAAVPTAVVLIHGGALAIEAVKENADAILDAHYPGMATGAQAIAEALYGRFSPAGKLTYSVMPAAFTNISFFPSMSMTEKPGRTYRYYPTSAEYPPALWAFGSGLTYSNWAISLVGASEGHHHQTPTVLPATWTVRLQNTGAVDSDEVDQVFFVPVRLKPRDCPTPKRQLIDFERVHVKAGETALLSFTVVPAQLELVFPDGSRGPVAGDYNIEFTNGEDAAASAAVEVRLIEGSVLKTDDGASGDGTDHVLSTVELDGDDM